MTADTKSPAAGIVEPTAGSKKKRTHAARVPAAKADLVLADGRGITFDLGLINIREYRRLFDKTQPQDEEDALVARVAGLSVEELQTLPQPDYRRVLTGLLRKAMEPLADPN